MLRRFFDVFAAMAVFAVSAFGQTGSNRVLDLCVKNTSSDYKVYSAAASVKAGDTLTVLTSRYTDFYPALSGKGALVVKCGGERTFFGTHDNKTWADWSGFTGDVHLYPYREVEGGAGFYGAVMPTRGKAFSPEDANPAGKVNETLGRCRVTLHDGAALATEKSAAGVRIGELNTERGSRMYGYYKSQSGATSAFYIVGALGTDAVLAGQIAAVDKSKGSNPEMAVGIVKEGKGTYAVTGNENRISGGVRVNEGTLLVCNDATEARSKKLPGGTGAAADASTPVAYIFNNGVLGGTGNVGGHVDLYGTLAPGVGGVGELAIEDYVSSAACNLTVHPASVISCSITDAAKFSSLHVSGQIVRSNMKEDFSQSNAQAEIRVVLADDHSVNVGDTFTLVKADKGRENAGLWFMKIVVPERLTWRVDEQTGDDGSYTVKVVCTSLENGGSGDDHGDEPNIGGGDEPGDGDYAMVDDRLALRKYLEKVDGGKRIGVAVPSWWRCDVPNNANPAITNAIARNFNLCVAENEMKADALQPSQGSFDFDRADQLVRFAKSKKMAIRGHALVWHSQCPGWISSDGKKNDKNWTREQLLDIMEKHITKVVKHFGDDVMEWDVVNETLDDDQSILRTNPDGYKLREQSVWVKTIGEDFIDKAFEFAHRANPNVKLYLNDYGCEFSGTAKALAFFNLAKRLKDSGVPIDGVGLQCHLKPAEVDKAKLDATVKKYAEIGLNCIFTEIDLAVYSPSEADLKAQAKAYKDIADVFISNDNCPHMVVWGITDNHSWIEGGNPLLFDSNVKEKPAYYSVQEALRHYVATGIADVRDESSAADTEVLSRQYFSLDGRRMDTPSVICVEQLVYGDGTARAHVVKF